MPNEISHETTPSKLSPDLQKHVRSPEFKAWFGDWENDAASASKIVDDNGEPLLVYFGGPEGIKQLSGDKRNRTGGDEIGYYFTKRRNNARFYAQTLRDRETDAILPASVYSVFLNIRSPYITRSGDGVKTQRVTEAPQGYDGYVNDQAHEIVVFSPEQVALVTEESPRIVPIKAPLNGLVTLQR